MDIDGSLLDLSVARGRVVVSRLQQRLHRAIWRRRHQDLLQRKAHVATEQQRVDGLEIGDVGGDGEWK